MKKRGCRGCGATCGVLHCKVCAGQKLCDKCKAKAKLRQALGVGTSFKRHIKAVKIKQRLEYLRGELRAERISLGELVELQALAKHIALGDVELLEAAGVPERLVHKKVRGG